MSQRRIPCVVLLALVVGLSGLPAWTAAQGDDPATAGVPTLAGDAGRTGGNPGPGPAAAPAERWHFASTKTGFVSINAPAVVDGVAYVSGFDPFLFALDAVTGAERWRFESQGGNIFYATPTVGDGLVYAGAGKTFYALDAVTGAAHWTYEANSPIQESAALIDGTVIVVGYNPPAVFALDAATGAERWTTTTTCTETGVTCLSQEPAAADGTVFIADGPETKRVLHAYDLASGTERWRVPIGGPRDSPLVAANGLVYVQSGLDLAAFDAATGEERWRVNEGWWLAAVAVAGETLYLGVSFLGTDPHPALFAFDALTGAERWRTGLGPLPNANAYAGPTVVGDTVYLAGTHGDTPYGLSAFDAATGAERWHVQTTHGFPMADPVVVGGLIYLGGGPPDGETTALIVLG